MFATNIVQLKAQAPPVTPVAPSVDSATSLTPIIKGTIDGVSEAVKDIYNTIKGNNIKINSTASTSTQTNSNCEASSPQQAPNKNDKDNKKDSGRKTNPEKNESEVWKGLDKVKGKDRKTSGSGINNKYYEWEYTHNAIEVYDNNGNHLGSMDPTTVEMY